MTNPSTPAPCFCPSEHPASIPLAAVFDEPTIPLKINVAWAGHLDGLIALVTDVSAWDGTDEEKQWAVDQINLFAATIANPRKVVSVRPGMMQEWAGSLPLPTPMLDDGWLPCDGRILLVDEYPELYAAIGDKWTNGDEEPGEFSIPDFSERSPRGTMFNFQIGTRSGSDNAALTATNNGPHSHLINRSASSAAGSGQPGQLTGSVVSATMTTASSGSGTPFSVQNPVGYVAFIIMSK